MPLNSLCLPSQIQPWKLIHINRDKGPTCGVEPKCWLNEGYFKIHKTVVVHITVLRYVCACISVCLGMCVCV